MTPNSGMFAPATAPAKSSSATAAVFCPTWRVGAQHRAASRLVCFALILAAVGLSNIGAQVWGLTSALETARPVAAAEPLEVAAALHRGGATALVQGHLNDLERRLFDDAANGQLEQHSLLAAALVAGGVDSPEVLHRFQRRLDKYVEELQPSHTSTDNRRDRLEAVFDFLHRRILHAGYRIECTDLRSVLDHGCFNCVSASVLFQYLAEQYGFQVCALEMPGHAMSRVYLPEGPIDVETTCAAWFRLMDDPKRQAQLVRDTLGTTLPTGYADAREVSNVGLVAMIYYNRGVELLAQGRYAEAAVANAKALHLDPGNQTARGNLLATLNNWAIALGQAGYLDEAMAMLRAGLNLEPAYEPFTRNYAHLHHQQAKQPASDGLSLHREP